MLDIMGQSAFQNFHVCWLKGSRPTQTQDTDHATLTVFSLL